MVWQNNLKTFEFLNFKPDHPESEYSDFRQMLQRPFPKLKKHHPTNLYMIYPMAQSVGLVCVERVKKMRLQGDCPTSSLEIHCHVLEIILAFKF
jgi:hypothetical protein